MDYMQSSLKFKIKKVLRYRKMYGMRRTYMKVKSQIHMKSNYDHEADWINQKFKGEGKVAIIGCGNFSFSTIAFYLNQHKSGLIKYAMDKNHSRAISLCEKHNGYCATSDYQKILDDPAVRVVYIASNHATHAEYAIEAIKKGKCVHIEKPITVNYEQLDSLMQAMQEYPNSKVFLGFNRPKSKLFMKLVDYLEKEQGAVMMNWFIAGHEIEKDHWYFSPAEGGRILGNLCHWTDLCLQLVKSRDVKSCQISPAKSTGSQSDFAVNVTFSDDSVAGITFSAKGHTFDGVREYLNVHRGNLLGSLNDFHQLTIDVNDMKKKYKLRLRDHGHKANIINSLEKALEPTAFGESPEYVYNTNILVLKIKEAIDSEKVVNCEFQ